jgi:hypothetical protein
MGFAGLAESVAELRLGERDEWAALRRAARRAFALRLIFCDCSARLPARDWRESECVEGGGECDDGCVVG